MKNIALLAMYLLLGMATMAQEVKTSSTSSSKAKNNLKTGQAKVTSQSDATSQVQANADLNTLKDAKTKASEQIKETHGTLVRETAKTADQQGKGSVVSQVAGSVVAGSENEVSTETHGTTISGVATSTVEAGTKGAVVSDIASAVGQVQSTANRTVQSVDIAGQTAIKSTPKVNTDIRANTNVEVKPVKVKTNTKVRTGVSIK